MAISSLDPNYVSPRANYAIYLRSKGLIGQGLLTMVLMAVVHSANAADDMTEAAFSDVSVDASAAHQRPRCSPTIMQRCPGDTAGLS